MKPASPSPLAVSLIELGPVAGFMVADVVSGIWTATLVLMIGVVLAFAVSWQMQRRVPAVPLITLIGVLVFGSLGFYFNNDAFIKLEPTVSSVVFGLAVLGPMAFGICIPQRAFGSMVTLDDRVWRILTLRFGLFCLLMALLNEIVWRQFSTETWVLFRGVGNWVMSAAFLALQFPLVLGELEKQTLLEKQVPGE